mmetsp:Transcript_17329/g.25604  ORF Transcript_17329/g.25604 Transcript_17329/m.25604 type:complete len:185 (+) Transcript_17329:92-646(+)|eukprot:CAMPEP_0194217054 /NCGR_PEP_ID=MMETSP0156-20130528/20214_1 /TAXON_ID=33649 /ORGANISM="Thalassionema nitzschioides, Strain L26-B" /LENGTH=184 /DNA_ID=CAMNT_0038945975 /DNA_START=29 /DNA_END=583 /DNA_ORIENTATION=-
MRLFTASACFCLCATATAYSITSSNRRQFLESAASSTLLAPFVVASNPALAADNSKDILLVQQRIAELKACTSQLTLFQQSLSAAEPMEDAPKLPPQISFKVFQSLSNRANDVPKENFEADDFLGLAAEYAEHAGSARDFSKLAKMGRLGENGSEEVAVFYAKKAAEETKETEKILKVLGLALE